MPRSIPALVKPELLVWARESAGFTSIGKAAEAMSVHPLTLEEWEKGYVSPTIPQLRKLGEFYKRPIAVFFLDEPPRRFAAQREFRRLPGVVPESASPELLVAMRWSAFRREAAIELYRLAGEPPPHIDARLHPQTDPEEAGAQIRDLLGVSWRQQSEWATPYEAFRTWRIATEAKGVLVFQTSDVELEEMRGTCVPDQPLPVILLNGKDAPHGRIFSLLHEFSHILLRVGGHLTSRMIGQRSPEEQPLEIAANAFAAAALLPASQFRAMIRTSRFAAEGDDLSLKQLAQRLKVSPEAILRRMTTLGLTTESVYRRKREAWGSKLWYVAAATGGGPPIEVKTIAKDGRAYTQLVLDAYDQRLISTSAASDYLGVRPRHFPNIRRELSIG